VRRGRIETTVRSATPSRRAQAMSRKAKSDRRVFAATRPKARAAASGATARCAMRPRSAPMRTGARIAPARTVRARTGPATSASARNVPVHEPRATAVKTELRVPPRPGATRRRRQQARHRSRPASPRHLAQRCRAERRRRQWCRIRRRRAGGRGASPSRPPHAASARGHARRGLRISTQLST
jgi:hypothetical protein